MSSPLRSAAPALLLTCAFLLPGAPAGAERVRSGLVAFYPLTEGGGSVAIDRAVEGFRTDLTLDGAVAWLGTQNGVQLDGGRLASDGAAAALIEALQATGASTVEVWLATADLLQNGPARIVEIDGGAPDERYALGQVDADIAVRLVHSGKSGTFPRLVTGDAPLTTALTHIVHTFDGSTERLYIDGVARPEMVERSGDFSNWLAGDHLHLGNNTAGDRPWRGVLRLAAIYDRALSASDVAQNFAAGADAQPGTTVDVGPDRVTHESPGAPPFSVELTGQVTTVPAGEPFLVTWSQVSGPGTASFTAPSSLQTGVDFPVAGDYVLRLAADAGGSLGSDLLTVHVAPPAALPTPVNVFPPDGAVEIPPDPALEADCAGPMPDPGHWLIAADAAFTTVVHDSGQTANDPCQHVAFAGLTPGGEYYWSVRRYDGAAGWSDWSTPTRFTTSAGPVDVLSLRSGEDGYSGAADADIRGSFQDPTTAIREWNQGAQDVLRIGRRPDGSATDELYRSMLRFEVGGLVDTARVIGAYLELIGYEHNGEPFPFASASSFYALRRAWGEGDGITRAPVDGEVSWTYAAFPSAWTVPGADGMGSDRDADPILRGIFTSGEVGHKTFWSSGDFVELVRSWIGDPAANHGVQVRADDESFQQIMNVAAREHGDPGFRPRLVVQVRRAACDNGLDDDGDGFVDLDDPGCSGPEDDSEQAETLECANGLDDDGDGLVDLDDPGCRSSDSLSVEDPACQDGLDNDGDLRIDFDGGASVHGVPLSDPDPSCDTAWRRSEARSRGSCGLGFEVAVLVMAVGALRRRRGRTGRRGARG